MSEGFLTIQTKGEADPGSEGLHSAEGAVTQAQLRADEVNCELSGSVKLQPMSLVPS